MINSVIQVKTQNSLKIPTKEKEISQDTKNVSTKIVVGAGLAALAAVGIYILRKGKGNVAETLTKFKDAGGKFLDGKAILNNGEKYTGTLKHTTKSGKQIVLKYENGNLIESNISNTSHKFKGDLTVTKPAIIQKKYNYDESGVLQNMYTSIQPTDGSVGEVTKLAKKKYNNRTIFTITGYNGRTKTIFTNEGGKGIDFIKDNDKYIKYSKDGKIEFVHKGSSLALGADTQFTPFLINSKGKIERLTLNRMELPGGGKVDVNIANDRRMVSFDSEDDKEIKLSKDAINYVKEKCKDIFSKISDMRKTHEINRCYELGRGYEPPKMDNITDVVIAGNWHHIKVENLMSDLKFNQ